MEPVEPGALTPLQAARLDKGWKAARLAAELGVSETTLSRWENGRQQPTLGHQQRLCEVLDKDPAELGFQGTYSTWEPAGNSCARSPRLVGTATMETVLDLGGPDALDRFSLAVGRPTRGPRHSPAPRGGHGDAPSLYHHLSSLELVDAVTGHLRGVTRLPWGAQHRLLRRLAAAVAGETAGHAAWLFHDLGDQKLTERYYADAAIATRKAGDPAWMARVQEPGPSQRRTARSRARAGPGARQAGARSATATRAWLAGWRPKHWPACMTTRRALWRSARPRRPSGRLGRRRIRPGCTALTTGGRPGRQLLPAARQAHRSRADPAGGAGGTRCVLHPPPIRGTGTRPGPA